MAEINIDPNQPENLSNQPSPSLTAELLKLVLNDPEQKDSRLELARRLHEREARTKLPEE